MGRAYVHGQHLPCVCVRLGRRPFRRRGAVAGALGAHPQDVPGRGRVSGHLASSHGAAAGARCAVAVLQGLRAHDADQSRALARRIAHAVGAAPSLWQPMWLSRVGYIWRSRNVTVGVVPTSPDTVSSSTVSLQRRGCAPPSAKARTAVGPQGETRERPCVGQRRAQWTGRRGCSRAQR